MSTAVEKTLVFVYGTLLAGESNHGLLATAQFLGEARTLPRFELHDLGAFPGLAVAGATSIAGELYSVDEPTLRALDELEEHPTYYQRIQIPLLDGRHAWVYVLDARHLAGAPVIASGSWRAR